MKSAAMKIKNLLDYHKQRKIAARNLRNFRLWAGRFMRENWKGLAVIFLATIIFFWPIVTRISSYSEGGDAMFNAWTLSRNHHCILQEGCPSYVDGNIYFPNSDTMLYSETQLSAGLLTLPLHFIDENPIFSYNVWTIASFFFSGFFMYLLAKYISRGNEPISILSGLIFEFAPFKMAAIFHLQNLSIFCLPLAILLIMKYFRYKQPKYLWLLLPVLIYQFYASWYQMVFVLIAIGFFLLSALILKITNLKTVLMIGAVTAAAVAATLPLAKEYIRFSKANDAKFSVIDQTLYSSSLMDYVLPHEGTLIGKVFYHFKDLGIKNAYNLDSYSYHGVLLYLIGALVVVSAYKLRKKTKQLNENYRYILAFIILGLVGFLISLGPLLKFKAGYYYPNLVEGLQIAIPMPYFVVDKLLPQLSFIRALGRASVLVLLALCCLLAYFAYYLSRFKLRTRYYVIIVVLIMMIAAVELMPLHTVPMQKVANTYNLEIPNVYKYIKKEKDIDNLIVFQAQDYPGATYDIARAETVLWSGYHNKNIFNGYSGYTPPTYFADYSDYVNFEVDDIDAMKKLGLRYVLVDQELTKNKLEAVNGVRRELGPSIYEDERYALFKL